MNANEIIKGTISAAALCAAGVACAKSTISENPDKKGETENKPNVLIIYTDEQNFRTIQAYRSLMSEEQFYIWGKQCPLATPNLDYLAANGVIMTNCYVSTPVSTPSRASFMTGLYPQKTNCYSNNRVMDKSLMTIPKSFNEAGYATGMVGKAHICGKDNPGWVDGTDVYHYGFTEHRYMFNRGHWKCMKDSPTPGARPLIANKYEDMLEGYPYTTDYLTDKVIDFIDRHKDEPFCCMLGIPDPHTPDTVCVKYREMFEDAVFSHPATADISKGFPKWFGEVKMPTQAAYKSIWGMVKCIDDNVGRLISKLRDEDLLDKTIILFTSDHGDMIGEHGHMEKNVPWDGSMKVGTIFYAPGIISKGAVVTKPVSNIDVYPTLNELCGLRKVKGLDGKSFADLLQGKGDPDADNMVFSRFVGEETGWVSVTTKRYKLVISSAKDEAPWLIDRQENPDETVNYYENPEYKDVVDKLTKSLAKYCVDNNDVKANNPKIRRELGL